MKKLLILISLAASCAAQNIDTLPSVTGADIAAGDKLLLRDVSRPATTAGQPMVATTIDQLVAVPSFFNNLPHGSFSLSKLAQSGATTGQVPTWNGTTWVPGAAGEEVSNDSVNAAIVQNAAASKLALGPESYIYASDYGVVSGNSSTPVATANVVALNAAIAASSSLQRPLVLKGDIYVNGQVIVGNPSVTIIGYGAAIYQQDLNSHGIMLSGAAASPANLEIFGLGIYGQGIATHLKAGIYGRKWNGSAWVYLASDITLRDIEIAGFETGTSFAEVAMLQLDHVSCRGQRVGHDWYMVQTGVAIMTRVVGAGAVANSVCWKIDGGTFATKILGGEFGGNGIEKFATVTSGKLMVESVNLEAFTGNQLIDLQGTTAAKWVALKNSRIAVVQTATQAVISAAVNALSGLPIIEWANNDYSSLGRRVEIWGATIARGPIMLGQPVPVTYATTQGGAVHSTHGSRVTNPGITDFLNLTLTASQSVGELGLKSSATDKGKDTWAENLIFKRQNNRTGAAEWTSLCNDMLARVLYAEPFNRETSGTTETDLYFTRNATDDADVSGGYTLPAGTLTDRRESVVIEAWGNTAANANNKQLRFYYGGNVVMDFGALAANNEDWTLKITMMRGYGTTNDVRMVGILEGGAVIGRVIKTAVVTLSTTNTANAIATRITGQGTSNADITMRSIRFLWLRSPQGF